MSLTQYYTATTLDGFIADTDRSLEWLCTRNQDRAGILNYAESIADVGALAMGSTTYQSISWHDRAHKDPAEWKSPYDIPGLVFTSRQLEVVPEAPIEFVSGDVPPSTRRSWRRGVARRSGSRRRRFAGQFADTGLLDEVIVYIAPVTLGSGAAPATPRRAAP